jgi:hypothetical protein
MARPAAYTAFDHSLACYDLGLEEQGRGACCISSCCWPASGVSPACILDTAQRSFEILTCHEMLAFRFRCFVAEVSILKKYDKVSLGNWFQTFRDHNLV